MEKHKINSLVKKQILLTLFSCLCLTTSAQTLTLGVHQNYIPVITQHGDTLVSSIVEGNQWYKNNVAIEGATGQMLVCKEAATYKVMVIYAATGCNSSSEKFGIITALPLVNADLACKVYPNPSSGLFNLIFGSEILGTIQLKLLTIDGKLIMKHQLEDISKTQIIPFGDSGLAKGTYTLSIHTNAGIVNRLIIVQ